jgi:hypothetical protein
MKMAKRARDDVDDLSKLPSEEAKRVRNIESYVRAEKYLGHDGFEDEESGEEIVAEEMGWPKLRVTKQRVAAPPEPEEEFSAQGGVAWSTAKVLLGASVLTGGVFMLSQSDLVARVVGERYQQYAVPIHYSIVFVAACLALAFVGML